ncbi:MAG: 50S ribosomal protein L18 [bacterium]|nr:50S ribosomal protein L18 [bacterium]
MNKQIIKNQRHSRRKARVRAKVMGTSSRPRLSVYRSLQYVYAQLIDDENSKVLAAATDKKMEKKSTKTENAKAVGLAIGEAAKKQGILEAVFDRGGRTFHGRVKAVAEGARESGLKF